MSETIAAIATASGNGSINILRVSGPEAVNVVDRVFYTGHVYKNNTVDDLESDAVLSHAQTHTIHYGWIGCSITELIDEVLVLLMRGPRSYTAEDVVEIHCHGGGFAAGRILDLLLEKGVRLAEPGEFTKRAFLNGRIDLTQAESVMEVIRAKSDLALATAEDHLRGDVRDRVRDMREILLSDMAYLEAALDDPEHIELTDFPETLRSHLLPISEELDEILRRAENGRRVSEGIRTVIVGRPNVGKSSFLNCILRQDRAIVTEVPGTTRDTLEEDVRIGRVLLRLIDTAGIRDTGDPVEHIGVEKAREAYRSADFLICVLDASEELTPEDRSVLMMCKKKPSVVLLNKSDLLPVLSEDSVRREIFPTEVLDGRSGEPFFAGVIGSDVGDSSSDLDHPVILPFSAETGSGLNVLEALLEELFLSEFCSQDDREPVITSLRQKEALIEVRNSIGRIFETLDAGMPEDLLTVDLLAAFESLGRVTGDTMEDDLVDRIFSEFCMGK